MVLGKSAFAILRTILWVTNQRGTEGCFGSQNVIDGKPFVISKIISISVTCFSSSFSGAKQNIYKNKKESFYLVLGRAGGVASSLPPATLAFLLHCTI